MARDYVTVANLAISFVSSAADAISAPDESSKPARAVAAAWDEIRKFVLSRNEWNFARRRASLSARVATTANPVIGYDYAFPLPVDCRRFLEVLEPAACRTIYALEGDKDSKRELLVNTAGPLLIRYIRDVADPALWSDEFTEAFVFRLAWQICDDLTGDKSRKADAARQFALALRASGGTNAKQDAPRRQDEGDWVRSRRGGRIGLESGWH